jgi:hypothetical protein
MAFVLHLEKHARLAPAVIAFDTNLTRYELADHNSTTLSFPPLLPPRHPVVPFLRRT